MIYSVSTLQTVADCDEMLAIANKDKAALLFKQTQLQFNKDRFAESSVEVEAELPVVTAELASLNALIATLPDGDTKENYLEDKRKLESKIHLLKGKQASYGTLAQLEKEWGLARVAVELTEADAFIAAITTRKAEL